MKKGILTTIIIFVGTAWGLDNSPPQLSGIFADPNPFSPNGDGRADSTFIHFSLSEPAYVSVWEGITGRPLKEDEYFPAGPNSFLWDGSNLDDGTWDLLFTARDTVGNQSDTVSLQVIIDTEPPHIDVFSFEPNPFSPDSNGIQDYCKISFTVTGTHPQEYDQYFTERIGRITIWNDSVDTYWDFTPDHNPTLPPFPVYFAILPVDISPGVDELVLHFIDWGNSQVDITIDNSPSFQRIGDLTNKMTSVSFWVDSIPQGESATLDLYAFTGNATVEIYDSTGNLVSQTNFWNVFRGDGNYFTLWGPGPIPDGLYNVKIFVEDESYNLHTVSGEVIANSVPTTLSDVYAEPPIISPQNQDNNFDITQLHFTLSEGAYVSLKISRSPDNFSPDQIVKTLLDSVILAGGPHAVSYNGTDEDGNFISLNAESTYYAIINAIDPLTGDQDLKIISITVDNLPPSPPTLIPLDSPTSSPVDTLRGTSEPGTIVYIYDNNLLLGQTVADSVTGKFTFPLEYQEGNNSIFAISLDVVLNQSTSSDTLNVVYDANPPIVSASFPNRGEWISQDTIYSVWVTLSDASSGIDLDASYASLRREGETYPSTITRIPPDTLLLTLSTPISPGSGLDGHFSISIMMVDIAGNTGTDTIEFGYDSEPPNVTIWPVDSALLDSFQVVQVFLSDELSGPDYEATSITLTGPQGTVSGYKELTSDSTLLFTIEPPLSREGAHDGRYTIEVTARDVAGAERIYTQTLIYDTRAPLSIASYPESDQVVTTPLSRMWTIVSDSVIPGREPSGLDPSASEISLLDPEGNTVPGEKFYNGDTLGLQFAQPLSTTGNYTVNVYLKDKAGNEQSFSYNFFFDTQSPSILTTIPMDGEALRDTFSEFTVIFQDPGGTGMDPTNTWVKLLDPYGAERAGNLIWRGADSLSLLLTVPLNPNGGEDGLYMAIVYGKDLAGHPLVPTNPDTVSFVFDNHTPHIISSWPDSGVQNIYLPDSVGVDISDLVPGIDAVSGIDFNASTITLVGPNGEGVPGHKEYFDRGDGTGLLFWQIAPDADVMEGEYRMDVHVVDKAGNSIDYVSTFVALKKAPTVISTYPDSGSYVNSIQEVRAVVLDRTGSGIDTSQSVMKLLDPSGTPLTGTITFEGTDTFMTFIFTPETPPQIRGKYTIYVLPIARNGERGKEGRYPFTLDNVAPQLVSSYPSQGDTIWSTPERIWLYFLEEDSNLDTTSFSIVVTSPSGKALEGTASQKADTLFFTPTTSWTEEGSYLVSFNVQDMAGNITSDSVKFNFLGAFSFSTNPKSGDTVRTPLKNVTMYLKRRKGSSTLSWYLFLTRSNGDTVPGSSSQVNETTFVYTLAEPLKADGSDVGSYNILGGAVNDIGDTLRGEATFVYWVDTLPPKPPIITSPPPERTMEDTVSLSGKAEPLSMVLLWVNDTLFDSTETEADSSFKFGAIRLNKGENILKLKVRDRFDNLSDSTTLVVIQGAPPFEITADKPITPINNRFYISLPKPAKVTLKVFNLRGDFVWKITKDMNAGINMPISWPGLENYDGHVVNNGPYLVIVKVKYTDGKVETKKDLFAVLR